MEDMDSTKIITDLEKETGNQATKSESGLTIISVKEGTGDAPSGPTATVTAHYEGKLLDGTIFDSSFQRGEPIDFPLNQVIRGWTEGLQKMKVGGSAYLVIPPELGYGENGVGGVIPANATLVFKVELIKTN